MKKSVLSNAFIYFIFNTLLNFDYIFVFVVTKDILHQSKFYPSLQLYTRKAFKTKHSNLVSLATHSTSFYFMLKL